jgi:eukaryotic-like serine/threonine-protein kinase
VRNLSTSEMDAERWQRVEAIYHSAISLAGKDRAVLIANACAGDESMRLDVLSLLESADITDSFLEEPALSFGLTVIGLERDSLVGSSIGRYKILETLGHGGMGEVFLAHDTRLVRRVALKLLPASITDDRERVRRFEQEARAASAISHPNVAHIYEIGESEGRHYISMEYVKGPTLRHLLREKSLSTDNALDIAIQVATALSAAHRAGVIHRDIKPENVIIADDEYVKVLDFGLAKLMEHSQYKSGIESEFLSSLHTEPELFMGTSHYMSPEQVRRQAVDLRTDLWSLGVVIYEMLTFNRPFPGESFSEVILAIVEHEPELASRNNCDLPDPIQALLWRALQKRPEDRYQTADELLSDLRQLRLEGGAGTSTARSGAPWLNSTPGVRLTQTKANRETTRTVVDPVRPKTLSERFDTVADDHVAGRSILTLARRTLAARPLQIALAVLLLAGIGVYFALSHKHQPALIAREINLRFNRLNLSGNISEITLSPDGKYVASVITEQGKQAIHITELATASDLRITEVSDSGYSGLAFSPDSSYVYYLENSAQTAALYRVSKLGGGQRKILNHVNTPVAFSPNGEQIAFARIDKPDDPSDLVIAQADGSGEHMLAKGSRAESNFFLSDPRGPGPVWSPDGKMLACLTRNRSHGHLEINLEVLSAETGAGRFLNATLWENISRVAWLADGSGLIIAATEKPGAPGQLYLLSLADGHARKVTNDPNNYSLVSAARDSSLFLALNTEDNASVWQLSVGAGAQPATLAVAERKGVTKINSDRNGRTFYTIYDGIHNNIWVEEAGTNSAKQLTFESDNGSAMPSSEGRYVVFVSDRSGTSNIWRMGIDGTQPVPLTTGRYSDTPWVTPDGRWVIYRTGVDIRKVSIEGGESVKLFDKITIRLALSPDGRRLALFANDPSDNKKWYLEIYDLDTVARLKRFEVPPGTDPFNELHWTPDGQGLAYVGLADGAANIWLQPVSGGAPVQLTTFRDAQIGSFVWSPKGDQIRCVRRIKAYIPVLIRLF